MLMVLFCEFWLQSQNSENKVRILRLKSEFWQKVNYKPTVITSHVLMDEKGNSVLNTEVCKARVKDLR